jgi:hypothetical protein
MDYLVYVAIDAENLQFFLWYRDYVKRFESLDEQQKTLSPAIKIATALKKRSGISDDSNKDVADELEPEKSHLSDEPRTSYTILMRFKINTNNRLIARDISQQPFRDEVNKIVAHYIKRAAPRELNISHQDRTSVLHALEKTTHPSAFATIAALTESTLRDQLHPNFVRWTICNGNRPKVFFVRGMGSLFLLTATALSIVLCLSGWRRWWRILVFIPFFMGITILTAAYKGLCILLHHRGNMRSIRPWEDLPDSVDEEAAAAPGSNPGGSGINNKRRSRWLETFGMRNEFATEAWVKKWQNRPILTRIMEPSTTVLEEGVTILQSKIVTQSQLWGLFGATLITAVVTSFPIGRYFT